MLIRAAKRMWRRRSVVALFRYSSVKSSLNRPLKFLILFVISERSSVARVVAVFSKNCFETILCPLSKIYFIPYSAPSSIVEIFWVLWLEMEKVWGNAVFCAEKGGKLGLCFWGRSDKFPG